MYTVHADMHDIGGERCHSGRWNVVHGHDGRLILDAQFADRRDAEKWATWKNLRTNYGGAVQVGETVRIGAPKLDMHPVVEVLSLVDRLKGKTVIVTKEFGGPVIGKAGNFRQDGFAIMADLQVTEAPARMSVGVDLAKPGGDHYTASVCGMDEDGKLTVTSIERVPAPLENREEFFARMDAMLAAKQTQAATEATDALGIPADYKATHNGMPILSDEEAKAVHKKLTDANPPKSGNPFHEKKGVRTW